MSSCLCRLSYSLLFTDISLIVTYLLKVSTTCDYLYLHLWNHTCLLIHIYTPSPPPKPQTNILHTTRNPNNDLVQNANTTLLPKLNLQRTILCRFSILQQNSLQLTNKSSYDTIYWPLTDKRVQKHVYQYIYIRPSSPNFSPQVIFRVGIRARRCPVFVRICSVEYWLRGQVNATLESPFGKAFWVNCETVE